MPLSEHEQRLLEQIERALVDDDPKFASSVRTGDRRLKARRMLQLGAGLVVIGLAVLVGGAVARSVPLGVFGFLIAFAGVTLGVLNYKAATGAVEAGSPPAGSRGTAGAGRSGRGNRTGRQPLKSRLEERFRRRYDQ
ncbi:MAG: FIG017342: transmembrane protein [uncultured Blastococcus sp.]|uniref:FIG017342: transmembrane protein n=1 Tax=uncultured Blastococcus sp. TaxID=217144 RepID=A0A6J4J7U1_9ACTN|nr:MAG: FIG017342: transmembrane protein [uncultured Blastococcus sp.]